MAPISWFTLLATLVSVSTSIRAIPTASMLLPRQDSIMPLTPAQIAAFKPYTWYAATIACNISDIMDWTCGENLACHPGFAGYDPTLDEVIVVHQGTAAAYVIPVITDLLVSLSVLAHQGFAGTQSRSAPGVIAAVEQALSLYSTKKVTAVGHSLGAAIALLDAVYLPLHLPSDVTVRYVGYSSPRVGNQAFADYVDAQGMSVTHINNKQDPVSVLPTMEFFEYHHVSGEIHIRNDAVWVSCPGQDNPSDQCSTGAVTYATRNATQHPGPFDGVSIGVC
ncbi:alpha/beta-hydrolase [Ganoderma leucocontextum]|nr:alpha/beta-hydrolase [Ganoderma leucocontextum]